MAHTALLYTLTDELVQVITGYSSENDAKALKACKDAAVKNLKYHRFGRTNHFNVQTSLSGLVEKCKILGNDPVAEALEERLQQLDLDEKWTPEILSLLLALSNRPAENARVENLELLRPPTPPPTLTWRDIFEHDPPEEPSHWQNIDYGGDSSDNDDTFIRSDSDSISGSRQRSPSTSVELFDVVSAHSLLVPIDKSSLEPVQKAQAWKHETDTGLIVDELQLVREVLNMVRGLPTSLFSEQQASQIIVPNDKFQAQSCSSPAIHGTLEEAAAFGTAIMRLRASLSRRQIDPLLQRFTALISRRLDLFDKEISALESRYVGISQPCSVSLLEIITELATLARPLLTLREIFERVAPSLDSRPCCILEVLFEIADTNQLIGDLDIFKLFAELLINCLGLYLRPIETWIAQGQIPSIAKHFCITTNPAVIDMADFWTDRYRINTVNEYLHAPKFMHNYLDDILDAGKSIAFIKEMGFSLPQSEGRAAIPEPTQIMDNVANDSFLVPFSQHFHEYISSWLATIRRPTYPPLRHHLFTHYNLLEALTALRTIYLASDGALFLTFADALSQRLDTTPYSWKSQPALEALARASLGAHPAVDDRNLTVAITAPDPRRTANPLAERSVASLSALTLSYSHPWPLSNIIAPASAPIYQRATTFLLQLRRALRALTQHRGRAARIPPMHTALRHALLHALQTTHQHAMHVLAARGAVLDDATRSAESVTQLRAAHADFVAGVARTTLQGSGMRAAREALVSLCDVAVLFGEAGGAVGEEAGAVSLGRRRAERIRGLRGQVGTLSGVLVGEFRRFEVEGIEGESDRGGWVALAEMLEGDMRRSGRRDVQ